MTTEFYPEKFFTFHSFKHIEVFNLNAPCWITLKNLPEYFKKVTLGVIEIDIPSNIYLVNPSLISIGKGTVIEPGAYIEGPCIIGENCEIRHMAYIRPNTLIGDNCVIGHATEVKESIFLDGAKAPHFNYVGNSIIGHRVNLGAGVTCANVTLHHREIIISYQDSKIATGLKKFGAVIGDDSSLGCHCVINPGSFLKKRTLSRATESLQGNITRK